MAGKSLRVLIMHKFTEFRGPEVHEVLCTSRQPATFPHVEKCQCCKRGLAGADQFWSGRCAMWMGAMEGSPCLTLDALMLLKGLWFSDLSLSCLKTQGPTPVDPHVTYMVKSDHVVQVEPWDLPRNGSFSHKLQSEFLKRVI